MSPLSLHFQRIKEIVDWSWTLALLCVFGYLTLGQIAQLYYAMLFLGGVATSFGLFYDFSCQKLAELDSLNPYELQKANASAFQAEILLNKFAQRNPTFVNRSSRFAQAKQQVDSVKVVAHRKFQDKVSRQRETESNTNHRVQPKTSPQKQPGNHASPSSGSSSSPKNPVEQRIPQPPPQRPTPSKQAGYRMQTPNHSRSKPSLRVANEPKITESQYKSISNRGDYEFVSGYFRRSGTWVNSYYRRKRSR